MSEDDSWPTWLKNGIVSGLIIASVSPLVRLALSHLGLPSAWLAWLSGSVVTAITFEIPVWGILLLFLVVGIGYYWRPHSYSNNESGGDSNRLTKQDMEEIKKRAEERPDWKDFTSADIEGINWRWEWEDTTPTDLDPFCPECKMELSLSASKESIDPSIDPISTQRIDPVTGSQLPRFVTKGTKTECEKCGFTIEWDKKEDGLREYVRKEIRRRKRTGEYDT